VFAHELAHLHRGDAWTGLWFGLGQAVFFPLPWFWWLRRQVGLCQEYLADAAAAGLAARVEDYAEFLVSLSRAVARPARCPRAATAVLGNSSDLFRRITMLLKSERNLDDRHSRRWAVTVAGGFLSLAMLLAGVGVSHKTVAADEAKDAPKAGGAKDAPKKPADVDEPKGEEKPVQPKRTPPPRIMVGPRVLPPNGDFPDQDELFKRMQQMMDEVNQRLQQRMPGAMMVPLGPGGRFMGGLGNRRNDGRLGAMIEKPSDVLVEQLDLPKGQGMVIGEVKADSAAAKAGLKANDILMELAGKPVSSDATEFRKQLAEIKADTPVDAVVLRKGKKETVKGVSLPEAKANRGIGIDGEFEFPNFPNAPALPAVPEIPNFVPGAQALPVGPGAKTKSVQINNDQFTIHANDDGVDIRVTGTIEDGKTTVKNVTIRDGAESTSVDTLARVPEKYRKDVENLLKSVQVKP
jgi:hypothetical protein